MILNIQLKSNINNHSGKYGSPVDIWSFGIVVLQMLYGKNQPPLLQNVMNFAEHVTRIKDGRGPLIPDFTSRRVRKLLRMSFIKNPTERATAQNLIDLLHDHPEHNGVIVSPVAETQL